MTRFALLLALAAGAPAQDAPDLQALLAAAVDLPTAAARADAARELARRKDVDLDAWLAAARAFAPRGEVTPGQRVEVVDLTVGDVVERTELAIFVPPDYDPSVRAPLMLSMHGTGGEGRHVLPTWIPVAQQLGMLVLAPSEAGPNEGFAATERERLAQLAALRWMRRTFNVDENQVYVSGFSRGGHLAWDLGTRYPDRFAALVPMVGGPRFELGRGAANMRYLENVAHLAIRDLQGALDQAGLVWSVREAFRRLAMYGAEDAVLHEFADLGHNVDFGTVDWNTFLPAARRDPRRERVVVRFAREGQGRSHWVEVLAADKEVREEFTPTIKKSAHAKLDEEGLRRFVIDAAEEKTGRLAVTRVRVGRFEAETEHVTRFRLYLEAEMFDPAQAVQVQVGGRTRKQKLAPDTKVLLAEFVERFDRTFLPVAVMDVRK
jgi:predicted esterase